MGISMVVRNGVSLDLFDIFNGILIAVQRGESNIT